MAANRVQNQGEANENPGNVPRPYFVDISDAEFMALVPWRIRSALPIPFTGSEVEPMPYNAVLGKVRLLTSSINSRFNSTSNSRFNSKTQTRDYVMRRLVVVRTFSSPETRGAVADCEVWYHRSGCSHGKVLLVQVLSLQEKPFLRLGAARVIRQETEDRILLLESSQSTSRNSTTSWITTAAPFPQKFNSNSNSNSMAEIP